MSKALLWAVITQVEVVMKGGVGVVKLGTSNADINGSCSVKG